ncbi:RNA polymerase sigma factor [uncultured Tenacibaculum sp.]|uniref:RNA polymerase sigma factor n=1 Tax=uncultured Tenacibaculum sp. TaxID=174713 RepID=UPI00261DA268|nr:RNA polymerase sigma factor [uncultured Tenacibaculum sp.]
MDSLSDSALMLKVKSGERHTLGLLYERYKKRLFGFFFQMSKDANLCEDLVQNVFIRVIKYKHTYTEESNFLSWIFKIARNVYYDHFKGKNKNKTYDIEEQYDVCSFENAENTIEQTERIMLLKKAINQLPEAKKELIILSKMKELKYKELGEIIGCSEGNARIRVHRALHDLKKIYLTLDKR